MIRVRVSSFLGFPLGSLRSDWLPRSESVACVRVKRSLSVTSKKKKGSSRRAAKNNQVSPVAAMESGPALYPLHRCKIIHLVRHAQGFHNVAGEADYRAYESYEYLDASLTPMGWDQVGRLRKHVTTSGIRDGIGLVVVSPLTRTMQTAVGVFGGNNVADGDKAPPLMVDGVGKAPHPAISSTGCAPFVAVEWCREHMGLHPCDKRRSVSEYKKLFPTIDFSEIQTDEDTWWKPDSRENAEELYTRGKAFVDWLLKRKEKRIAVVSHSSILIHLLELFGGDCSPVVQKEIRSPFANCELRTVVLADRRATSKIHATSDFGGGVPEGPSAGSDLADIIETTGKELEEAAIETRTTLG